MDGWQVVVLEHDGLDVGIEGVGDALEASLDAGHDEVLVVALAEVGAQGGRGHAQEAEEKDQGTHFGEVVSVFLSDEILIRTSERE